LPSWLEISVVELSSPTYVFLSHCVELYS